MPTTKHGFSVALAGLLVLVARAVIAPAAARAEQAPSPVTPIAPAPPEAATPPPTVSPKDMARARLHFQQGVALFEEHNYDAALAEFEAAYGASKEPIVLYNLGLTYKALFRYVDALDALGRYLDESASHGQTISADRRTEVEGLISGIRSLLADITIVIRPPEANVRVDGRPIILGLAGTIKLAAGTHAIDATEPGYSADRREIVVVAGVPQRVSLELAPIPHTGHVGIRTDQTAARVTVDGRDLGQAPVDVELSTGGHHLDVTAPGFASSSSELVVAPGESRTMMIRLESPPPVETATPFYHRWWFWTGIAVVAAAAGAYALWPRTQAPIGGSLGIANGD
jgi:hypothetical protein